MYSIVFNEKTHVPLLLHTNANDGKSMLSGLETTCPLCFRKIPKESKIVGPGWKLYERNYDNFVHLDCWETLAKYAIATEKEEGSKQTWYVIPRNVLSPKVIAWAEDRVQQKRRLAAEEAERKRSRRSQHALAFSK